MFYLVFLNYNMEGNQKYLVMILYTMLWLCVRSVNE